MQSPMPQLGIDEYQVGWICALSCEYAAAKAMLDEQHQMVSRQDPADSNIYTLGRVHKHNVVIACLPAGAGSIAAVTAVATQLSRTFGSVRFLLMVGIGGGIPDLQKGIDVRLGDVAVSQPSGRKGGVVQYNIGKSNDSKFELNGQLIKPPSVLLTALATLRAEHQIDNSRIPEYLKQMIERWPKMQQLGYSFPTQEKDILQCTHSNQASKSCENCDGGKVKREPRQSTQPVIHYGVIASGNIVIKSAVHRDQLRDECGGAICVEMKAAGLMVNFPCLFIRGICDYADSSKIDKWQNYAAATAAAFAKELLLHVSVEQTSNEQPVQEILGFYSEAREYPGDKKGHNQQQQSHNYIKEIDSKLQEVGKIPIAQGALYNSSDAIHMKCHPWTRVDLLRQIQHWANQPSDSKPILWLHGIAGCGKSTISWTFADWLNNQDPSEHSSLGASFFFRRGERDRGSAQRFFPTIIRQLIAKIPGLDALVANVIKADPLIFDKALAEQFHQLILRPLQDQSIRGSQMILVVVVDALDECDEETDIMTILQLWSQLSQITTTTLRLFLTSRPELCIRLEFERMSADVFRGIDLVDAVHRDSIYHDLLIYLNDSFSSIRSRYNHRVPETLALSDGWPGRDTIAQLVDIALPLFLVAATICRVVGNLEFDPRESLDFVLGNQNIALMSRMELIYLPVLQHLYTVKDDKEKESFVNEFRVIVGSVILLAEPLSLSSLSILLGISITSIEVLLSSLHSVFSIPVDHQTPVRMLHLSFMEFLLSDPARRQPFGIDGPSTHLALSTHCLRVLSGPDGLCKNICNLTDSRQPRHKVEYTTITSRLSPTFQYACRYWVYHVQGSSKQIQDGDATHSFLKKHFLHWLEALSLMDQIFEAARSVKILQSCVSESAISISAFLEDAERFIFTNRYVIGLMPLQLYSSAIIFVPQHSVLREYWPELWIKQHTNDAKGGGPELQQSEGQVTIVYNVAFSPDSFLLASGSGDFTIRLWDVQMGQAMQKLEGHSGSVQAVAFSPDGCLLASGSYDQMVRLWTTQTGQELLKLEGHYSAVNSIAFCPDGSLLASGSGDHTVRLWDVRMGREIQKLEGHSGQVNSVAFSPDGSLLASAGDDQMVRLWTTQTGQELLKLEGHYSAVNSIAFCPDGSLLASGSGDHTVRLWDVRMGREIQKLEGHSGQVNSVAFSPDGSLLASAGDNQKVRLWDIEAARVTSVPHSISRLLEVEASKLQLISTSRIDPEIPDSGYESLSRAHTEQLIGTETISTSGDSARNIGKFTSYKDDFHDEISSLISDDDDDDDDDASSQGSPRRPWRVLDAEDVVAGSFAERIEFSATCEDILEKVNEARFTRNLRRMLKKFYVELEAAARSPLEREVALLFRKRTARSRIAVQVVKLLKLAQDNQNITRPETTGIDLKKKARDLESWIRSTIPPASLVNEITTEVPSGNEIISDNESSSSAELDTLSKTAVPNVSHAKDFLFTGKPFHTLLMQIEAFAFPNSESLIKALSAIPFANVRFCDEYNQDMANKLKIFVEDISGEEWDWWPLSPPRSALRSGFVRILWRCQCGTELWQDVSTRRAKAYKSLFDQQHRTPTVTDEVCHSIQTRNIGFNVLHYLLSQASTACFRTRQDPLKPVHPTTDTAEEQSDRGNGVSESVDHSQSSKEISSHTSDSQQFSGSTRANRLTQVTNSQNQGPLPNSHNGSLQNIPMGRVASAYVLLGAYRSHLKFDLEHIETQNIIHDGEFFHKLKEAHRKIRSFWRHHFSIWRMSHCDFVKFEMDDQDSILPRCLGLPRDDDKIYEFRPRPPLDNPPLTHHQFEIALSTCAKACILPFWHVCRMPSRRKIAMQRIPKRLSEWEIKKVIDEPEYAWGLQVRYRPAIRMVIVYNSIILIGPLAFWAWWQKKVNPLDLQNASIPTVVTFCLLGMFYTLSDILKPLRDGR